jgi:hypothetical protein
MPPLAHHAARLAAALQPPDGVALRRGWVAPLVAGLVRPATSCQAPATWRDARRFKGDTWEILYMRNERWCFFTDACSASGPPACWPEEAGEAARKVRRGRGDAPA